MQRRHVLKSVGALASLVSWGVVTQQEAWAAAARNGFDSKTLDGALAALGGRPASSNQVQLNALDITEDGSLVPVGIISRLPGTTEIHLLIEKNPNPLSASFRIPPGTLADVSFRVKMAESSRVLAVVRAEGKLYMASKNTAVTIGSCGG